MYSIQNLTNAVSQARHGEVELSETGSPQARALGLGARFARGIRSLLSRLHILRGGAQRAERQEKAATSIQAHLRLRFNARDLQFTGMNAPRLTTRASALSSGIRWTEKVERDRLSAAHDLARPFASFAAERPLSGQPSEMRDVLPAGYDTWPRAGRAALQDAYRETFKMVLADALHRGAGDLSPSDIRGLAKTAMASALSKCEQPETYAGYRRALDDFRLSAFSYIDGIRKSSSPWDMKTRMESLAKAESRLMSYETLAATKKCSPMPLALGEIKDAVSGNVALFSRGLSEMNRWAVPILADRVVAAETDAATAPSSSAASLLKHILQDADLGSSIVLPDEVSLVLDGATADGAAASPLPAETLQRLGVSEKEFTEALKGATVATLRNPG